MWPRAVHTYQDVAREGEACNHGAERIQGKGQVVHNHSRAACSQDGGRKAGKGGTSLKEGTLSEGDRKSSGDMVDIDRGEAGSHHHGGR